MRPRTLVLLALALVVGACSGKECLPEPPIRTVAAEPEVYVQVTYRTHAGEVRTIRHASGSPSTSLEADRSGAVDVLYAATDSTGLRMLFPGLTIQHTVGVGVEQRSVDIKPVTADCPTATLNYRREVPGTGERRALIVTAVAESWLGARSVLEPITIRMR